jgi:transcriptional regulator with XRE-family HTH domain
MIGQRVAAARKLREMTGRDLADRAHISYSLLTKVEAGHAPASQDFVTACARALQVDPRELTGEPYRGQTPASDRADAAVAGIRAVLLGDDLLDPDAPRRRSLAGLQPGLATAAGLRNAAKYVQLAEVLPGSIRELLAALVTTPAGGHESELLFGALADAYSMAQTCTRHLGYLDLAALAVERLASAATRSGDPLWRAVAVEKRAHLQMRVGAYDAAASALDTARHDLADLAGPAALAVAGTLCLRAGDAAARAARADRAADQLAAAEQYAHRLDATSPATTPGPTQGGWYGLPFGTPNVRIHQVAAAVELGDSARAVALADQLGDLTGRIDPDRVGYHHVDTARARLMHGDRTGALAELCQARRVAPQLARHHPMVRETLDVLLRTSRRTTRELRELATWLA